MADTISLNRPSKQLVLDAINRANPHHEFTFDEIEFDTPALTDEYGRNTIMRVTATENFAYSGFVDVFYYRLDLDELFQRTCTGYAAVSLTGTVTVGDVVAELNTKYMLHLEQVDIVEPFSTVIADTDEGSTIKLTATSGSYAYTGTVLVRFGESGLILDMVIGDKLLDGLLYHPLVSRTGLGKVIGDPKLDGLNYPEL